MIKHQEIINNMTAEELLNIPIDNLREIEKLRCEEIGRGDR